MRTMKRRASPAWVPAWDSVTAQGPWKSPGDTSPYLEMHHCISVLMSCPTMQLPEPLTGKTVTLADVSGSKATLVMFICNHCPFVVLLKQAIIDLAKDYASQGVGIVAISSNSAASHPQDGPELMAKDAKEMGYPFPYLYDESQDIAKVQPPFAGPEQSSDTASGIRARLLRSFAPSGAAVRHCDAGWTSRPLWYHAGRLLSSV